jgi:tetratricopeptide (TPR) repeat protein
MASATSTARDAPALLDPEQETPGTAAGDDAILGPVDPEDVQSCHRIGRILLESAARTGRRQAAIAAAEIFRSVLERAPKISSLQNGLGAALVERARFETSAEALATLTEAKAAFQAASAAAERQAAPRAVHLRYQINLATTLWKLGEQAGDPASIARSVEILRSISAERAPSSFHWSHIHDNLGNALMALGHDAEAIIAYRAALAGQQTPTERGRSLNNLGTAYAEQGHYAEARKLYGEALALQPRDHVPLAWGRTHHNLGSALLQEALASKQSQRAGSQLSQAIKSFEAALQERQRQRSPQDWAITTANLAGAYLSLGTHLAARTLPRETGTSIDHIRRAISLYKDSLQELTTADANKALENIAIALQILRKVSPDRETLADIHSHQLDLLAFAAQRGLPEMADKFRSDLEHEQASLPQGARRTADATHATLPAGLAWPTETYSQASRERKENIVQFLTRVWLPLIQAGMVDLRTLRAKDRSAAKGIDNFTRTTDPVTGQRRRLPPHLDVPTKRQLNDRLADTITTPGDRPARLDWALRSRARRADRRK